MLQRVKIEFNKYNPNILCKFVEIKVLNSLWKLL